MFFSFFAIPHMGNLSTPQPLQPNCRQGRKRKMIALLARGVQHGQAAEHDKPATEHKTCSTQQSDVRQACSARTAEGQPTGTNRNRQ